VCTRGVEWVVVLISVAPCSWTWNFLLSYHTPCLLLYFYASTCSLSAFLFCIVKFVFMAVKLSLVFFS
jgi:hypothetical protein